MQTESPRQREIGHIGSGCRKTWFPRGLGFSAKPCGSRGVILCRIRRISGTTPCILLRCASKSHLHDFKNEAEVFLEEEERDPFNRLPKMLRTIPRRLAPRAQRACRASLLLTSRLPLPRLYATETAIPPSANDLFANGANAYYVEE